MIAAGAWGSVNSVAGRALLVLGLVVLIAAQPEGAGHELG
jgi:hypothetical protein